MRHCGHPATNPGCDICRRYDADDPPGYRAFSDATRAKLRVAPALPTTPPPPCVHAGDELTPAMRDAAGLDHAKRWTLCTHAEKPLGEHVCSCRGCGPKCRGYQPDTEPGVVDVSFTHGLGDAVNFAHLIPLYAARGHTIRVRPGFPDHTPIFRAAGAGITGWGTTHPWHEPKPGTNKNLLGMCSPLPDIGPPESLWDELAAVRIDFTSQVTDADRDWAERTLAPLPRPVVLLHTQGFTRTAGQRDRHYPPDLAAALQRLLLERTRGSVVVLDRDGLTPRSGVAGVTHVADYNPGRLYELTRRADLLVGVDSGPLHFARLTDTSTVGIWRNHHPADYALPPRANTAHVVASRHRHRSAEAAKWNVVESPDDGPHPATVAGVAFSLLYAMPRSEPLPPLPLPPRHSLAIFPDAISHAAHHIRQWVYLSDYDHRPHLHPGDYDFAAKLSEEFRSGYACLKWAVAKVVKPRAICEIGVGGGCAALAFLDACPEAVYVGIDSGRYEDETGVPLLAHVEERMQTLGFRGRILRQDSATLRSLPGEFDLVHVDGSHQYDDARRDVALALRSGAAWVLVDDARDSHVSAATFAALAAWRPGCTEWAMFEDSWTGSILIYTGSNARS